jgi:lysophospholipase L1-like esterase
MKEPFKASVSLALFGTVLVAALMAWGESTAAPAVFKPAVAKVALDRGRVQSGGILQATYTFRSNGPALDKLSVFVHVVRPGGAHLGADFSPDLPATEWPKEGFVREGPFPIAIPDNAAPGSYQVWVGLFSASERIELDNADRHRGSREYHVGDFEVVAAGATAEPKPAVFDWLPVDEAKVVQGQPRAVLSGDKPVERIALTMDRKVLYPMREPKGVGKLTLTAFHADGSQRTLSPSEATIKARTKSASGNVEVVEVKGDKVLPKEGGVATLEAVVVQADRRFTATADVVVVPFFRDHQQALVLKLFMGMEGDPVERLANDPSFRPGHEVMCTFEEALEVVRKTDNLTRGIPKIIYLVGWQKGGHDYGYPAWDEVNPKLKRAQDATALDSLRWLIREGRKFNTTVSLHINMADAYKQSPLWEEYLAKDCISKSENGQPYSDGIAVKGEEMYNVVYPKEWEAGLAQRRIDGLIKMIPELKEGHTIHIDVFIANRGGGKPISPWHAKSENGGLTPEKYVETQRKIFHYWRDRGFDVTGEGTGWAHPPGEHFVGLQAMSWWYSWDQMQIPECLGARGRTDRGGDGDFRFGSSMHGEEIWKNDKMNMPGFLGMFCRTTLPWHYLSRLERVKLEKDVLYYSDGVVARTEDGKRIIRKGDFVLREDDNLFVPTLWSEKQEIIAYSRSGYEKKAWQLPDDWRDSKSVDLYRITLEGCVSQRKGVPVTEGKLILSLGKDEAVSIVPENGKLNGIILLDPARPDGGNTEWRMRHGERVADMKLLADTCEVLFIGDSITECWRNVGKAVWEKEFAPLHAVDIGISGTQTQNVLWQFENGAIDGLHPRVAVLMIGVNNIILSPSQSAADIARGISAITARLREKLPNTKILLLGTFPKDKAPATPDRRKIQEINTLIAKLDDGKWIRFLDIGKQLLDKGGTLTTEISADGVHLTAKGYQMWADAICPVLREMRIQEAPPNGAPSPTPMPPNAEPLKPTEVSGAYYDWTKTKQPERPWVLPYYQTLVMKIFLAEKQANDGCKVFLTFEQALEVIKRLDTITLGIPKIVYLVGWQHNGHDSKYPDWSVVNPRLKRERDAQAVDSLKWLMAEGVKYHTTVSLHINMFDAYADSPLWETYLKNDIIAKDEKGVLIKGEVQGPKGQDPRIDTQSYYISYAREWEKGLAQKRIDGLLDLLPIQKAGTVHIDAFHTLSPRPHCVAPDPSNTLDKANKSISPYLKIPVEKEVEAQRKIYRYFRDHGVDVTSEGSTFLRPDAFVGLQPMAWDYRAPAGGIPPSLYCGTPMRAEPEILKDPVKLPGVVSQFCNRVVPWYYDNNTTVLKGSQPLRAGDDLCYPALWCEKTLVAYSFKGYESKTWTLPPGWESVKKVVVSEIRPEGLKKLSEVEVKDGKITISLAKEQGVMIQPEGNSRRGQDAEYPGR